MGKTPHAAAGTNFGGNAFNTNGPNQPGVGIAGAAVVGGGGEDSVDMMKPPEASTVDIRIAMIGNVDRCPGCCMSRGLVREFYSCVLSFASKTFPNPQDWRR